jgi:glycosyltransferase involved in cell wall biosynthesis
MTENRKATQEKAAPVPIVLSVVMPNYNHSEFFPTALEAILSQTRCPDEIIIIDDGSIDNSRSLIEQWAARDSRIRPIFNPANIGTINSINFGISAARGQYVCLMAADDVSRPEFFSTAIDALKAHPNVALFCAEVTIQHIDGVERRDEIRPVIRPSNKLRAFSPAETQQLHYSNDNFIVPLTAVFRRDLLLAEGGFDPLLGSMADGFLSRRLALKYGFCFAPQIVVERRVRDSGLSRSTARSSEAISEMLRIASDRIDGDPVFPPGYAGLFDRRLRFAVCRLALTEGEIDWKFLHTLGASNKLDRYLFSALSILPRRLASFGALVWLALRLRPYSLPAMLRTATRRLLTVRPGRSEG